MDRPVYNLESWIRTWNGRPCLILGRGRSTFDIPLSDIDAFRDSGGKTMILTELGSREEYRQRADAWIFMDHGTLERCKADMKEYPGILWTQKDVWRQYHVDVVGPMSWIEVPDTGCGFAPQRGDIYMGGSTAYVAAQMAWYAGAEPIWFAGVDLHLLPDGRTHADKTDNQANPDHYQRMLLRQFPPFDEMASWIGRNAFTRHVYKTSQWSLLPFPVKPLPAPPVLKGE
jgi:hypothetical protein